MPQTATSTLNPVHLREFPPAMLSPGLRAAEPRSVELVRTLSGQHSIVVCLDGDEDLADRVGIAVEDLGIQLLQAVDLSTIAGFLESHHSVPIVARFSGFGPESVAFLESVRALSPDSPVVVLLDSHSVRDALAMGRHGAFECLSAGAGVGELSSVFQAACERVKDRQGSDLEKGTEPWRRTLIGQSPSFERMARVIRLVAPRRCTVLISGETGTGKEMVARAIHMASDRARKPMVSVNCAALPENLIEADLFGHVKGAFTGATESRIGRFEQANGGTIFLDEIGELPFELQAKLLRVLQEREVQKLGGTSTIKVDVRVIAASNVNLLAKVQQGKFREDLYYRLNVVPIHLPALRERATDIQLLVNHFVQKVCNAEGLPGKSVTPSAIAFLTAYAWPGNVRQLENAVEQSVVMNASEPCLEVADFSLPRSAQPERVAPLAFPRAGLPEEGMDLAETLRQFERALLDEALTRTRGNKTLAAEMLRVPRTTLIHKLRALGQAA